MSDVDLRLGDCLDVMRGIPDGSVDAVVTDPPWMAYETGRYDATGHHAPIEYLQPDEYCGPLFGILKDGGACLLWCRWDCFEVHAASMRRAGFVVKNCVVWSKPNHTAGDLQGNFGFKHEMAVFAVKGRWQRHSNRETNLWQESHLFSRAKRDHPTQKPIGLMCRSVNAVCPPVGVVLDPFMGSGTTGVACVNTGRSFIGIERDPDYFRIASDRIALASAPFALASQG